MGSVTDSDREWPKVIWKVSDPTITHSWMSLSVLLFCDSSANTIWKVGSWYILKMCLPQYCLLQSLTFRLLVVPYIGDRTELQRVCHHSIHCFLCQGKKDWCLLFSVRINCLSLLNAVELLWKYWGDNRGDLDGAQPMLLRAEVKRNGWPSLSS